MENLNRLHRYTMFKTCHKIVLTIILLILIGSNVHAQSMPDSVRRKLGNYYNSKQWVEGMAYLNILLKADKNTPFTLVQRSCNGVIRFETGDFKGAIKDFDYVIGTVDTTRSHWGWTLTDAEHDKPEAYMALGRKRKAGLSYEYFARRYQSTFSSWMAVVLYMNNNKKAKYRKILPVALANHKLRVESDSLTRYNSWRALDYAELLLIAEKPAEAIIVLNNPKLKFYDNRYIAWKNGLLAVAYYLINPKNYQQIRNDLTKQIEASGTTKDLDFVFLNTWMKHVLKDPAKRHYLGMLLAEAKDGGFSYIL